MSLTMSADDDDRVITFEQLPQPAQAFLKQHFANKVPAGVVPEQIAAYLNKNSTSSSSATASGGLCGAWS